MKGLQRLWESVHHPWRSTAIFHWGMLKEREEILRHEERHEVNKGASDTCLLAFKENNFAREKIPYLKRYNGEGLRADKYVKNTNGAEQETESLKRLAGTFRAYIVTLFLSIWSGP